MDLQEILLYGGGAVALLMTVIQITPIKINPWSAIAKWMGRAINAEVIKGLSEVKTAQEGALKRLEDHIKLDEKSKADASRARILRFNNELLRDIPHTKEDFIEALKDIDGYERYCRAHPDYENGRAVHAIANIGRAYDERLKKHDFL